MRKGIKLIFASFTMVMLCALCFISAHAIAPLLNYSIDVSLEQQENSTNDKIRYISTIEDVESLDKIESINFNVKLTKGTDVKNASKPVTKVYTSVGGTNGKSASDNTYYAVITLTEIFNFKGYTLEAYFDFTYSDSSSEETNKVTYSIPETLSYTVNTTGLGDFETSSSVADFFTASSIEGGNIFHAWNWSMSTIEANLDNIKAAGYTAVQTSPMQPQKDYWEGNAQSDWWKFYQPLGFCIAPYNSKNALGTKPELISMVSAAHSKGLKVIVDVVANHLAGDSTTLYGGGSGFDGVQKYEPEIYGTNGTRAGGAMLHEAGSNGIAASDSSHTTDGHIYIPDLDTGNSHVQQRVLSLCKEYIDCGVDGFRFDAAKHIETDNSSEPNGASQFWPTVINGTTEYATQQGKEKPYYYGEILYGCGNGRSYSWYTKYMDVIDNTTGNNITSTFNGGYTTSASTYNTGCEANQVVVWAESHDTYANESHDSTFINQSVIDKSYAYSAARGKLQMLYLARPCADGQFGNIGTDNKLKITCPVLLGAKGDWDAYKSAQITAVNKFHNYWGDASEWITANDGYSMIARYNATESGLVIVNISGSSSLSNISVPTPMKDGSYKDLVTGNLFTISSGKVSGTMDSCGIAVLYSADSTGGVSISSNAPSTFYTNTMTATYTIMNATSATMTVNGESLGAITSGASLTFGSDMVPGEEFIVSITANGTTETFTYTKVEAPALLKTYFEKPESWGTVSAKLINGTSSTTEAMTYDTNTNTYYVEYVEGTSYTNVQFTDGTNTTEAVALGAGLTYKLDTDTTVVYFTNNNNWSTVYAHKWGGTETGTEWPGVQVSIDSASGYYRTSVTGYAKIIFNNNSQQTADITIDNSLGAVIYSLGSSITSTKFNVTKTYKLTTGSLCSHTYGTPVFTWNEFDAATATFTCTKCNATKVVDAVITSEVTTAPTETETGVRTYTATATFEEVNYTDTKEETIPALSTVVTVPAVAPTCSTPGNILYYQKGTKYYSDLECQNEITLESTVLPATGDHTIAPGIYEAADGVTCSVCGERVTYTPSDATEIYFVTVASWGWTSCYVHVWGGTAETSWPGVPMTNIGTVTIDGNSYTLWKGTLASSNVGYTGLKAHDGGSNNTSDLTAVTGANCYISNWDAYYSTSTAFIYIPA